MASQEGHSSFIQTPQQLIIVVLLAFLVPIIGIVLLVQLVTSERGADPAAMRPEAIAERIQPVGRVEFGPGGAAGAARSGEQIVKAVCAACHDTGAANAPKTGDKAAWAPRIKQGMDALVQSVIKGKSAMPPKGGDASLGNDDVARAVAYIANQAGARFKEPAPKAPAPAAQAVGAPEGTKPAAGAAGGKKVYDSTCMACHATGVANAPKLGDKAAWAARIQAGMDQMLQTALKGKGAMPPKGGNTALSDAEVRAAVEFMVSQSK